MRVCFLVFLVFLRRCFLSPFFVLPFGLLLCVTLWDVVGSLGIRSFNVCVFDFQVLAFDDVNYILPVSFG